MIKRDGLPTIAIVLPILNEADSLPALIDMIKKTSIDEVVWVDGGSDDGSVELLKTTGANCLSSEKGRAKQMNAGAADVRADVLMFVHADTKISQQHILAIQEACSDEAVVGGRFDVTLSGQHMAFRVIEWMMNIRSRLTKVSTGDQLMFVRRSVFERLGGFADIPLMEDVALSKRLKDVGKIACLRERVETSSRRWENHGIVSTVWLMWKLRFLYALGVDPVQLKDRYLDHR